MDIEFNGFRNKEFTGDIVKVVSMTVGAYPDYKVLRNKEVITKCKK